MEIHTVKTLIPGLVEVAPEKLEKYKSLGTDEIPA
jgi:hypothetical protein